MSAESISSSESNVSIKIETKNKILPPLERSTLLEQFPNYISILFLLLYTFIIIFGETIMLPKEESEWCSVANVTNTKVYENPDFDKNLCRQEKTPYLLFLTQEECDYARRMFISVLYGAIIGFERRSADQPAGMRTMALVSLGSCFFTMCSMTSFRSSTMHSDAARVSAAIPSGVGFLGAGLIWKGQPRGPSQRHEVHGLATASGVWLSAAVGVGVGGKLWVQSAYAVVLVVFLLKIGPRMYLWEASDGSRTMFSFDDGWESNSESNKNDDFTDDDTFDPILEMKSSQECVVTREEQRWLLEKTAELKQEVMGQFNDFQEEEISSWSIQRKEAKSRLQRAKSTSILSTMDEHLRNKSRMRKSKSSYEIFVPVDDELMSRRRRQRNQAHVTLCD